MPVVKDGKPNRFAIRQISAGSMLGMLFSVLGWSGVGLGLGLFGVELG